MRKYDFNAMGSIWKDQAREIARNGDFVAHNGHWDLWSYGGTVYALPISGSGCNASVWCAVSGLRRHLYHLRNVCGYADLIPADWEEVNTDYLKNLGIA